jgi:hypothetical protein
MAFESLYNDFFKQADKESLKKMVKEYPYFAPAHFFALQQAEAGASDYASLAAKTALHFGDPLLLHYQLNKTEVNKEPVIESAFSEASIKQEEIFYEPSSAQPIDNPSFENIDAPTIEQPQLEETLESAANKQEEQILKSEDSSYEPAAAQPIDNPFFETPEEKVTENTNQLTPEQEINSASVAPAKETLLFEPLHTTDYFASQGIKLSEQVQTGDKVGRQLKSFTEWLKTMKKLHPDGLPQKNEQTAPIDNTVQNMAERSNQEEEVLTEAMAIVYQQQGKLNKAREIYNKLSLLNPSKSAYFAAKLNELQ